MIFGLNLGQSHQNAGIIPTGYQPHISPSIKDAGSGTVRPSALDQRVQADLGRWLQYGLHIYGEYW